MNDYWRETKRDINRGGLFGLSWFVIILVVVMFLGAAGWGIKVLTSDARGKGDAYVQKNSAANWVEAQAEFNQRYQDILATDRKIGAAKVALDAAPDDRILQTNYNGLVNYCLAEVGKYNSAAREYLKKDFRDADLPTEIDSLNPNTDCK